MINNFNSSLISLISLTLFIILSLSWLASSTLKEGRKALKEIKKIQNK